MVSHDGYHDNVVASDEELVHVSLKHEWRGDARTLEAACLRLEQVREAELFFARDVTVAHVSWILNAGFRLSVGIF